MNQSVAEERISAEQPRGGTVDYANLALGRLLSAVGVNLGHYQPTFVRRCVARRMRQCGLDCVDDYYVHLVRNPTETRQLGYALQRPSGSLFRDIEALAVLSTVLSELAVERSPLQLWLPGCACGEDAYALAMLANEVVVAMPDFAPSFAVYGTDTELEVLTAARSGVYHAGAVARTPPWLRTHYLTGSHPDFRIVPLLRQSLVFLAHDITTPSALFELDLICCRNLLGNLELAAQRSVLEFMHAALRPHGCLLLGGADALPGHRDLFEADAQTPGIYRRVSGAVRLSTQAQTPTFVDAREAPVYRAAFRGLSRPALFLDENFDICDSNAAAAALRTGKRPAPLLSRNLTELFAASDRARVGEALRGVAGLGATRLHATLANGLAAVLDVVHLGATGAPRYYVECLPAPTGDTPLPARVAQMEAALLAINEGLIVIDTCGLVVEFNPTAERLTGWSRAEALGQPHARVFRLGRRVDSTAPDGLVDLAMTSDAAAVGERSDIVLQHRAGHRLALSLRMQRVAGGGLVLIFEDVSEMNLLTEELAYRATHDALTGLLNREEFESRCRAALATARRGEASAVLCYIDVDQFKVINDTLGHAAGDGLLHELASELRSQINENDALARLGGDEFGVLLAGADLGSARGVVDALLDTARNLRFDWGGQSYAVTISIGAALIAADTENITRVMSMADAACFVAKDAGRDRARFAGDDDELSRRYIEMSLVGKIGKALDEGRFVLHYEDVVRLDDSQKLVYRELLVRMREEDGSLLAPAGFIQAAERYFLMSALDRWVLRAAFRGIAQLPADNVIYAVNLSGQSLGDEKFLDYMLAELDASGVDPERICFEITETAAVSRLSEAVRFIDCVSGFGCRFALDDFGSGMASFSYLKNFRVDFLKVDGSFVRAMLCSRADHGMVETINRIGHELGLKTIAEHVESSALLQPLREMGVDWAQGRAIGWGKPFDSLLR